MVDGAWMMSSYSLRSNQPGLTKQVPYSLLHTVASQQFGTRTALSPKGPGTPRRAGNLQGQPKELTLFFTPHPFPSALFHPKTQLADLPSSHAQAKALKAWPEGHSFPVDPLLLWIPLPGTGKVHVHPSCRDVPQRHTLRDSSSKLLRS